MYKEVRVCCQAVPLASLTSVLGLCFWSLFFTGTLGCLSRHQGGVSCGLETFLPGGLFTSISIEETFFSLLWHVFASALGRSSGDQVPEPALHPPNLQRGCG